MSRPLSPARAQLAVGYVFLVVMAGTTLPTPLYVLYGERFGFSPLLNTVIFAVYAAGVVAGLLVLGRVSDDVGRRPALLLGIAFSAASAVALLLTQGLPLILVARILSGFSAGIFTGTATTAIVDLAGDGDRRRATLIATVANIGGIGAGTLLSGVLAEYAPDPLRLVFAVHLALLVIAVALLWRIPETVADPPGARLRVQALAVPAQLRATFVRVALAGFAAFSVTGLFGAITPSVLMTLLGVDSHAVVGLVVFALFASSAVAQSAGELPTRPAIVWGCVTLGAGVVLIGAAVALGSLALFVVATLVAGAGLGAAFRAELALLTSETPPDERASVSSAFFVVLYVAISLPVLGVGLLSAATSLRTATLVFSGVVVAILATVLVLLRRRAD